METKEIRQLLKALAEYDASEFTLETGDYKLTVKRGAQVIMTAAPAVQAAPQVAAPQATAAAAPVAEVAASGAEAATSSNLIDVLAPIVGTFYAAPSPDAPSFVKVGDRVKQGTVLCIIEAMKLMNEIEAEVSGVVREVAVGNEDPVEYGQVLFRIEPD
ncbi:MAG: acetyl-CoA carboxylase biotin carboxyl carrier protein [Trueperaceae bacterium]